MENHPSGAPAPQVTKKHTPGPWRYQEESDSYTHIVRGPTGYLVHQGPQFVGDPTEANARLIAEAPAMLAALKLILIESLPAGSDSGNTLVAKLAEQAIAKAEGRS